MKTLYAALLVSGLMLAQGALAGNETTPAAAPAQPVAQTAVTQPAPAQSGQPAQAGQVEKKKTDKKEGEAAKTPAPAVEKK